MISATVNWTQRSGRSLYIINLSEVEIWEEDELQGSFLLLIGWHLKQFILKTNQNRQKHVLKTWSWFSWQAEVLKQYLHTGRFSGNTAHFFTRYENFKVLTKKLLIKSCRVELLSWIFHGRFWTLFRLLIK